MQLDDLYRQVIMDHYQNPRNRGELEGDDVVKVAYRNPSCGDEVTLELSLDGDCVKDVRFQGSGCSISMASMSMMTEAIKGKSIQDALTLSTLFRSMIKGGEEDDDRLGDLLALSGVSKFPARVKCATLAWNALDKAVLHEHGKE